MISLVNTYPTSDTVIACAVDKDTVWTAELNGWVRGRNSSDCSIVRHYRLPHGVDPTSLVVMHNCLWVGRSDGAITALDTDTLEQVREFHHHDESVTSLCVLPNGRVASACAAGVVAMWDEETLNCLASRQIRRVGPVNCIVYSAQQRYLVTHDDDHQLVFLALGDANALPLSTITRVIGHQLEILSLVAMTSRVWSSSQDETIRCWDFQTSSCLFTLVHHRAPVHHISLVGTELLFSASLDGAYVLWDIERGSVKHSETIVPINRNESPMTGSEKTAKQFVFCAAHVGYCAVPRLWASVTNGSILGFSANASITASGFDLARRDELSVLRNRVPFTEQELGIFMLEKKSLFEATLRRTQFDSSVLLLFQEEQSLRSELCTQHHAQLLGFRDATVAFLLARVLDLDVALSGLHEESSAEHRGWVDELDSTKRALHNSQVELQRLELDRLEQSKAAQTHHSKIVELEAELSRVSAGEKSLALVSESLQLVQDKLLAVEAECIASKEQLSASYKMLSDVTESESRKEQYIIELEDERSNLFAKFSVLEESFIALDRYNKDIAAELAAAKADCSTWQSRCTKLEMDASILQEERSNALALNEQLRLAIRELNDSTQCNAELGASAVAQLELLVADTARRADALSKELLQSRLQIDKLECEAEGARLLSEEREMRSNLVNEHAFVLMPAQRDFVLSTVSLDVATLLAPHTKSSSRDAKTQCKMMSERCETFVALSEALVIDRDQCRSALRDAESSISLLTLRGNQLAADIAASKSDEVARLKELHDSFDCEMKSRSHEFDASLSHALAMQKLDLEMNHSALVERDRADYELRMHQILDERDSHIEAANLEIRAHIRQIQDLEDDAMRKHRDHESLLTERRREMNDMAHELKTQVVRITADRDQLRSLVSQAQQRLSVEESACRLLREENSQLQENNDLISKHVLEVESALEEKLTSAHVEINRWHDRFQALVATNRKLELQCSTLESRCTAEENVAASLRQENIEMMSKLGFVGEHMRDTEAAVTERLLQTQLQLNETSEKLQSALALCAQHEVQLSNADAVLSRQQSDMQSLREELEHARNTERQLSHNLKESTMEVDRVISKLDHEGTLRERAVSALDASKHECSRLSLIINEEAARHRRKEADLTAQLDEAHRTSRAGESSLRLVEAELLDARRKAERSEFARLSIEKEASDAARRVEDVSQRQRDALLEANQKLASMQDEISRISMRLAASDMASSKLRASHRDKDELLSLLASEVRHHPKVASY